MSSPRVVELSQKLAKSANALREAYARMVSVTAEIQDADIVKAAGYTRVSLLIADIARINPRHASRLISHADAIAEVMTPTGHVTRLGCRWCVRRSWRGSMPTARHRRKRSWRSRRIRKHQPARPQDSLPRWKARCAREREC